MLFLGLMISVAVNLLYEKYLRPDNIFFTKCLNQSREWEKHIRKAGRPCYVFAGGSEVRMSIEPVEMWDSHKIAAINAGLQAGNLPRANAQIALSFLQKGDTLVISCASHIVRQHASHAGMNFCFSSVGFKCFKDNLIRLNPKHLLMLVCGDATNYCLHLIKLITRPECIYRYSSPGNARISKSGRVEVFINNEQNILLSNSLTEEDIKRPIRLIGWADYIKDLREACQKRNAHLIAYLPRQHQSFFLRHQMAQAALELTRLGVPVLKDPMLGCCPTGDSFSDTELHMSIEGGKSFSVFLADLIKNELYWTEEELLQFLNNK